MTFQKLEQSVKQWAPPERYALLAALMVSFIEDSPGDSAAEALSNSALDFLRTKGWEPVE